MGSLSGIFQRPVVAASAVALASVSADLRDKIWPSNPLEACLSSEQSSGCTSNLISETKWARVSDISFSESFATKSLIPIPNFRHPMKHVGNNCLSNNMACYVPSLEHFLNVYQSAELAKAPKPIDYSSSVPTVTSTDIVYRWHLPQPNAVDLSKNSKMVVVLLGWLGAKQKHLKKYADWYTSKGFHVITFTFPMAEILSYQVGGKAEEYVDMLVNHLAEWLEEECTKNLVFHTFSNTGWLIYGAMLEKFQRQDDTLMERIKGCIVDSAPVAAPDPQVWASGFSAAFLKKNSIAAKGNRSTDDISAKPTMKEAALLVILEKFFHVVLNLPAVNKRLSNVLVQLKSGQPSCPQLYIYSSADKVIPAGSVESFIEVQQRMGRVVRSCNFKSTPHVDHFRHEPELYTTQLSQFLNDCVLDSCRRD
ncbi:putative alpha/Beta hydrolase [Helianthus annuus]|uniref:Alpha/Beta hydrolase n=1 Tax=Helianthus annuus TaxID=4232 RepID=A0A251UHW5_HELAN|nr:transmembrane protein 53 [Helianthus annuus]XP_035830314.1 transmembrane protein 53 [Helianthus annuus]KAF5801458.1 putative alpha/Beta hydrolase [Helianthus annuus]KAJ0559760.1 putative alpha/Beta hydrolase [Helianthus annuus]KAJ0565854.1 putative alpha/Beta hydrolase [Helianthus annuus]KAJ0740068.1 putative alpha/Beta hydrolase [Helianthus annuus]KAJ0910920.1 putative alpha/Beta hydrolase [Helianthus annuus]